jgi:hypothetical protein
MSRRINMKNIEEFDGACAGCGACVLVCPVNAIKYSLSDDGFYKASIDIDKCINCGKCTKVCVKNCEKDTNSFSKGKLYSARSKDEKKVLKCTSGAIAYEISLYGIKNGYNVVGVEYDNKSNIARTVISRNYEDLERLKGSKYLQSKSDECFKEVIKECKESKEKKYIIFGTPCQIYGMKKAIQQEKITNEFIYVDLFCHGVPSYLVWDKYLNYIKKKKINGKKIKDVIFRDKKNGWHNWTMKISTDNANCYIKSAQSDFYKAFLDNILLNKACYTCDVRKEKSVADIRLGDFWGKKYMSDDKGVSAVLLLTKEGEELFNSLKDNIEVIAKEDYNEFIKYQSTEDYKYTNLRDEAVIKLQNSTLKKTIKSYRKNLSKKYVLKENIKTLISYLPNNIVNKIKKLNSSR